MNFTVKLLLDLDNDKVQYIQCKAFLVKIII